MSDLWAYTGASLLVLATLPQVVKLLRTRRTEDFAFGFVLLNLAGLVFLAIRSLEIGEVAFLAINVLSAFFWALLLGMKIVTATTPDPVVN